MKLSSNFVHKFFAASAVSVALLSTAVPVFSATKTNQQPVNTTTKTLIAQNQSTYRSNQLKFRFSYTQGDFVPDTTTSRPSSNLNFAVIDLWTKKHAQKIKSGAYRGGAEYPANVKIRVYANYQRLPIQTWVQKNQDFAQSRKFTNVKIAGKNAAQFESSGLYENKHTVFVNPQTNHVIVITLSQIGSGSDDAEYRRVYQQVINSVGFY